ncbi:MAG TPA: hypothetical protein VE326_09740 [Candidatus Binatia bacterium]|nr:hypothetical protein [Candidatus Binatia bacterium]
MTCSRIAEDSRALRGRKLAAAGMLAAVVALFWVPAPPPAAAAPPESGLAVIAQADTSGNPNGTQGDEGDDEEDENGVKIPPNLLEPDSDTVAPDTTGAPIRSNAIPVSPAPIDSGRTVVPAHPAQPETLRYFQPIDSSVAGKAPAPNLVPVPPRKRGGIFGLGSAVVILSLAVVHFFVVKAVK